MKLSIDSLTEMGAFAPVTDLVESQINWKQAGEDLTATVFVRPLSYKTAVSEITEARKNGGLAARIASCICDESGSPVFTAADITGEADPERGPLNHALTMELLRVIGEVSGLGKPQAS